MERHYAGAHPDYDFHGMTTLLDVELKAQGEERYEEAKNRLKHEVAKCVKLCLKPYKPNVQKSGEPSVRKAWEVLTDKEFEELCRGQCLQSREEILEAWHQSSSPPESLVVSGRDQDRVQENINFFFAVRKVSHYTGSRQDICWSSYIILL